MKKLKIILAIHNVLVFIIFCISGISYYKDYKLNRQLNDKKEEYLSINKDIENYSKLKNDIDIIADETSNINDKIANLRNDIDSKNNSIDSYNNKISDLNNKISKMTGIK